jgi:hypothetical protein
MVNQTQRSAEILHQTEMVVMERKMQNYYKQTFEASVGRHASTIHAEIIRGGNPFIDKAYYENSSNRLTMLILGSDGLGIFPRQISIFDCTDTSEASSMLDVKRSTINSITSVTSFSVASWVRFMMLLILRAESIHTSSNQHAFQFRNTHTKILSWGAKFSIS